MRDSEDWFHVQQTHNKLNSLPVLRLSRTIFRGWLEDTGGLRRDELLSSSFGTVTTRSVFWRSVAFLLPTARAPFFFPPRAFPSTFMISPPKWSHPLGWITNSMWQVFEDAPECRVRFGAIRCCPNMDILGIRYIYEDFRKITNTKENTNHF